MFQFYFVLPPVHRLVVSPTPHH